MDLFFFKNISFSAKSCPEQTFTEDAYSGTCPETDHEGSCYVSCSTDHVVEDILHHYYGTKIMCSLGIWDTSELMTCGNHSNISKVSQDCFKI